MVPANSVAYAVNRMTGEALVIYRWEARVGSFVTSLGCLGVFDLKSRDYVYSMDKLLWGMDVFLMTESGWVEGLYRIFFIPETLADLKIRGDKVLLLAV